MKSEKVWEIIGGIIFWIVVAWGIAAIFHQDPGNSDYEVDRYGGYHDTYDAESDYSGQEPENPYDDGTGHSAGFEWAQENEVNSCDGNSDSFIEGCEEYINQRDDWEETEYEDYENDNDTYRY